MGFLELVRWADVLLGVTVLCWLLMRTSTHWEQYPSAVARCLSLTLAGFVLSSVYAAGEGIVLESTPGTRTVVALAAQLGLAWLLWMTRGIALLDIGKRKRSSHVYHFTLMIHSTKRGNMSDDNETFPPEGVSKSNPVLIMAAVIGGLQVLLGGAALTDFLSAEIVGLLSLLVAGITAGYGIYTKGTVAPWDDVAAKTTPAGGVIAGPAAAQRTGTAVVVSSPDSIGDVGS